MIKSFRSTFLSNFWFVPVSLDGEIYRSVEHAYQAAKTLDPKERKMIQAANLPTQAKHLGKCVKLRPDWNDVKLVVMEDLLRQKFQHKALKDRLFRTGSQELIEGNTWNDTFWGVCNGVGENNLGKILMKIRGDI